jgi:seryl-tRNA synthetase
MLDLKFIRENPDKVREALKNRNANLNLDKILKLDASHREALDTVERLRAEKNKATEGIQKLGKEERGKLISQMKEVDHKEEETNAALTALKTELDTLMLELPNLPLPGVPVGKDENGNKVLKQEGSIPKFDFPAQDYLALAEKFGMIDIPRATKVSGARFAYLKGDAVLLEAALVRFTRDMLGQEGFIPLWVPLMLKKEVMEGTGYSAYSSGQESYVIEKDNLYLIGTGEHSLISYHKDEVLDGNGLPLRYTTFSPCFRREAGSYGKDTKGILRVHQFQKLEMVSLTTAEEAAKEFEFLVSMQEKIVQALKIPYRLVAICTGDMSKPAARSADIECYIPSEGKYRETHSASLCTDFQSRRLNIRYRKGGKTYFAHTLNATAFTARLWLVALLEHYQTKNGTIRVPEVLQKYMGKTEIK